MHRIKRRATSLTRNSGLNAPCFTPDPSSTVSSDNLARPVRSPTATTDASQPPGLSHTPSISNIEGGGPPHAKKPRLTFTSQLKSIVFKWLNLLLFFVPAGIITHYLHVNATVVFVLNFIAIIPLASLLSDGTEEVALYCGEVIGGLLNATFGNAVELIVSILALVKGEIVIVQTSLIGSILSNLLLVLGMAFFLGGCYHHEQLFNRTVAGTATSMLTIAAAALIVPTAFHMTSEKNDNGINELSRATSIILILVYASYLLFQLRTHEHLYSEPSPKSERVKVFTTRAPKAPSTSSSTEKPPAISPETSAASAAMVDEVQSIPGTQATAVTAQEEGVEEEREEPTLSLWTALGLLAVSTAFVALCAEALVSSISSLVSSSGISRVFIGLILLPIVGNAAEHATAVTVAIKGKMDLSIGVAVGSSMQIALLVVPLMVIIGWAIGKDEMNLYFDGFQVVILFVSVLLVNYLIADGKSNYLEGEMLLALYCVIAVACWFYPKDGVLAQTSEGGGGH